MTKKNHPNIRFLTPCAGITNTGNRTYAATAADAAMVAGAKKLVLR